MSRLPRSVTILTALGLVLAACTSASPSTSAGPSGVGGDLTGQTVTVIGTWTDKEETAFRAMVKPWEDETGATVKYQGTRSINDILAAGIPVGVLPDLAGLPGPGQMNEYVQQGALKPLDDVLDVGTYTSETSPVLVNLGQVDGKTYGVFIKAAVKGLIWYSPKLHDYSSTPPATWDELMSQGKTNQGNAKALWCLGISSGDASGWPATDWIEEILLHQAGPDVYNNWWAGKVQWTDPAIKTAISTYMNDVVGSAFGGGTNAVATKFDLAGDPLFSDPPGCEFLHQASFITGLGKFLTAKAGTDYNAFPFPAFNDEFATAVEGAGDLFGMFHDTPAARSLMAYLVTAPAQDVWVKLGGAISANKNATAYPDDITKRSADLLANAKIFVFDASDLMPSAMNGAFWTAIVDYVKSPGTLDTILANLDKIQADAYAQ